MLANLTTKLALRKVGLSSDTFNFSSPAPAKSRSGGAQPSLDELERDSSWPAWMSVRSLPLTAQSWLSPPPPPREVAPECPRVGNVVPPDRQGKLPLGRGKKVLIVFLRCVGCACRFPALFRTPRLDRKQGGVPMGKGGRIGKSLVTLTTPLWHLQLRKRRSSTSAPLPTGTART